jgi:hypothetical protein
MMDMFLDYPALPLKHAPSQCAFGEGWVLDDLLEKVALATSQHPRI